MQASHLECFEEELSMKALIRNATAFASAICLPVAMLCGGSATAATSGRMAENGAAAGQYAVVASLAPEDGEGQISPLTQGSDGSMWGVSPCYAEVCYGAIFRVMTDGTIQAMHYFDGRDGSDPQFPLTLGTDGWLYGTTSAGGWNNDGVIFKISGAGFVDLHNFGPHHNHGLRAQTPMVSDGQGGFYAGSRLERIKKEGALFYYAASGQVTLVARFGHRAKPNNLVMGSDGILYGTTGAKSTATFFSFTPGTGLKTLHTFDLRTEGGVPAPNLSAGPDGAMYGVLTKGGPSNAGTLYRMTAEGEFSIVHVFTAADPIGSNANGGLAIDAAGNVYGTTNAGGELGGGTVFSISPEGDAEVIQALGAGNSGDGYAPRTGLTGPVNGALWGMTSLGGEDNLGTVFRIDLAQ
jgi:uncharacterized repeat protein (TIGR03803 family)